MTDLHTQNIQCHNAVLAALGADVSAQSVKTNFGHERKGAMCTVLLKNKKAFEFHDDGWGGESEVNPLNEAAYQSMVELAKEKNIAQILFDNGWDFMKTVDAICLHTVMANIAESLIYKHTSDASMKKIMKRTEKAFVIINGNKDAYIEFGFKGNPLLADVKKHPKGVEFLTRRHADALARAKEEGMTLLNTPEQLKALGVVA